MATPMVTVTRFQQRQSQAAQSPGIAPGEKIIVGDFHGEGKAGQFQSPHASAALDEKPNKTESSPAPTSLTCYWPVLFGPLVRLARAPTAGARNRGQDGHLQRRRRTGSAKEVVRKAFLR